MNFASLLNFYLSFNAVIIVAFVSLLTFPLVLKFFDQELKARDDRKAWNVFAGFGFFSRDGLGRQE